MTTEPLITLDNVTIGYERRVVLAGIHLQIARGTFTGLLGANGSGKSTLIKTMLGIIRPRGGQITFHRTNSRELVLGYVPQRESLDPIFLLSSFEVVLMGVSGRIGPGKLVKQADKQWVRECLHRAGAADFAHVRFSELSGGQKQRVLIARALATKPDFLLLDEPTAGIDPAASQAIMELLAQIHKDGMTLLMVNHDLQTTRRAVQQVIWLHEEKVLHGPVGELLSRQKIEEIFDLEFS